MKKITGLLVFIGLVFSSCAVHKQTEVVERSFDAELYNKIKIETENGQIISTAQSKEPVISVKLTKRATGHTFQDARVNLGRIGIKVREDTTDSILRITVQMTARLMDAGCDVELSLPESLQVELATSNGSITAQGHQAGMRLNSSNGDISVSKTQGKSSVKTSNGAVTVNSHEGELFCRTSNGEIKLSRTVGDADIKTTNGKIVVEGHSGDIVAETLNGKIDASVVMPVEKGKCRFTSSNGAVYVAVKDSVSANVTLITSNGKIDIDPEFQLSNVDSQDNLFKARLGEGSGSIYLKTSNGKVSLGRF
ncbi:DUF4097 family beta strand repeat protein [candidate division WOR-3 bacterium]|nr:DUF4097 family beta strand repeat protein [candidate division WOR-3 bacterium]